MLSFPLTDKTGAFTYKNTKKRKGEENQVCVCAASTNLKARLALRNKAAQKWSKR